MSKRNKIYELIDENIETAHIREQVKEYISNLLKTNSSLEKSVQRSKKLRRDKKDKALKR